MIFFLNIIYILYNKKETKMETKIQDWTIGKMKLLNLFDDIPYKYVKEFIDWDDDTEIEVEIIDLDEELSEEEQEKGMCKRKFSFEPVYTKLETTITYFALGKIAYLIAFEEEGDDLKMCPIGHFGGQYGCDLCDFDGKDIDNDNMEKEWLDKNNNYCYRLHKKWLKNKKN